MMTNRKFVVIVVAVLLAVAVVFPGICYADECPAGGIHDYEVTIVQQVTDTSDGLEYLVCSKCGDSRYRTVLALGHVWSAWQTDTPATCLSEGIEVRACAKYSDAVHYEYRTVPSLSLTGDHQYVETSRVAASCILDGSVAYACAICGQARAEALPALGHEWGAWTTAQEPTAVMPGREQRACARCGEVELRELAVVAAPESVKPAAPEKPATPQPAPPDEKIPWYATEFFTAGPDRVDAVIVGSGFLVFVFLAFLSFPLIVQVAWLRRKQAEVRRNFGAYGPRGRSRFGISDDATRSGGDFL